MKDKIKRCAFDFIGFLILRAIDRITKIWATERLSSGGSIQLIPKVLELYYLPNGNTGAAFGILAGHRLLFLAIALIVVLVIAYILFNMPTDRKYRIVEILLVFIAAGGVGNMIDRIGNTYVIDFIYISCINFPVFNVADMYVSVCTVVLAVIVLFKYKEDDYAVFDKAMGSPFKKKDKK